MTCNGPDGPFHCSHPGWDYVSGWGVPDIRHLMLDIDGRTNPVLTQSAATATPSPQAAPLPNTFSTLRPAPQPLLWLGALVLLVVLAAGGLRLRRRS